MSESWYIDFGDRIEGPHAAAVLQSLASSGSLRPTDRVSREGRVWLPAGRVPGLSFASSIPPEATGAFAAPPTPDYEVLDALGAGGCGIVYKARQLKLDRIVALKTLSAATPQGAARFEKEARVLARLHHPNIVQVFDLGRYPDGRLFFAMELLNGEDLSQRIRKSGPVDERTALAIARQTAAGLAHAHAYGIVHRDVKPANLFLVPAPTGLGLPPGVPMVKVTDFGLALTRAVENVSDDRLTATGVVLGTPAYMPPEQFGTSDTDHRSDIYSLGASLFHALEGRTPFGGTNIWDVMTKKKAGAPALTAPVSRATAEFVASLMAANPDERPQSYEELIARIEELPPVTGKVTVRSGIESPPDSIASPVTIEASIDPTAGPIIAPAAPPSRKPLLIAAAVLVVAVVAIGVRQFSSPKTDTPPPPPPQVEFEATGQHEALFDGKSILGWTGRPWTIENDDEGQPVLVGQGIVTRRFRPYPDYRVIIGLDLFQATNVELLLAEEGPSQIVMRISRQDGAILGKRGDSDFEPLGPAVPYPSGAEVEGLRPYRELRYERTAAGLSAYFHGKPVGPLIPDAPPTPPEIRLRIYGGPVRIDSAMVDELTEKSP